MTLDATAPVSTSTLYDRYPKLDSIVSRRWSELAALARMRIGLDADITQARDRHRDLVCSLLSEGIEMRTIRRLKLDDVREIDAVLLTRREEYIERHNRRKRNEPNLEGAGQ